MPGPTPPTRISRLWCRTPTTSRRRCSCTARPRSTIRARTETATRSFESDEEIVLTEQVRNAGTVGATGLAATLSGGGGLAVTQPSSAYPDLAVGATGSNAPGFEAELPNVATCGVDAPATLDITTTTPAVETHRIALSLPTGESSSQLSHNAAGLPLAVPDDSATGVSSTVFVAERGRIKDLDVRLPGSVARSRNRARLPRGRGDRPDRTRRHLGAAGRAPRRARQLRQGLRQRHLRRRGEPEARRARRRGHRADARPTTGPSSRRTTSSRASTARAGAGPGRCGCATSSKGIPERCGHGG